MMAIEWNRLCRAMHGNGPPTRDQLGADGDGLEAEELLASGRVHVAPVAAKTVTAGAAAWGGRVTARQVSEQMGLLGNTNVLDRTPGGIVILAVNPGGHTCP